MIALKKLDLSHNRIERIENLSQLTNLVSLNLSSNQMYVHARRRWNLRPSTPLTHMFLIQTHTPHTDITWMTCTISQGYPACASFSWKGTHCV